MVGCGPGHDHPDGERQPDRITDICHIEDVPTAAHEVQLAVDHLGAISNDDEIDVGLAQPGDIRVQ